MPRGIRWGRMAPGLFFVAIVIGTVATIAIGGCGIGLLVRPACGLQAGQIGVSEAGFPPGKADREPARAG